MREPNDRFIEIRPGIFRTSIAEESNFAGAINLHFIPDDEGCLLIDTGFPTPASQRSIEYTLTERLHIPFTETRLFITHPHPDHNGLAPWCAEQGMRIFMNGDEFGGTKVASHPARSPSLLLYAGIDVERYQAESKINQIVRRGDHFPDVYEFEHVPEGTVISRGGPYTLETCSMAGHTRYQQGVMDREASILFCADQIIMGLAPAIMTTKPDDGLLGVYFDTLDWIRKRDFTYILPAHGEALYKTDGSIIAALSYIEDSYGRLCTFILNHLQEGGKFSAFELAVSLYDIPESQFYRDIGKRTLMTGKILSCLEYMYKHDSISREFDGPRALYYI